MANGINFCDGCVYGQQFERKGAEPAYLNVVLSGLGRAMLSMRFRFRTNVVEVRDAENTVSVAIPVPDAAIDSAGSIKRAIDDCDKPAGLKCGAVAILAREYPSK
jgi:hypothetical protein